jgi:OFA family oxalate/formate antiporter-like MFS transporter
MIRNRWVIATAAAVVMMTTGTLYSWAIFTQPLLVAFHWDVTTTTWAYAIANFCLAAIGAVVGGFWQDRVGPRLVAMTGMVLWGAGNVAAGLGTAAWGAPWLYLCYGAVGGVGAGMAYITPLSMVTKWFPDCRGLAGGVVAGGFGLGAFIYNQLVPRLAGFHAAASDAGRYLAATGLGAHSGVAARMTPADIAAVMHVFVGSGCVYLLVGLLAAALFCNPPEADTTAGVAVRRANPGLRPSEVLRTRQFYLLWLQLFANVIAGITIISNAVFILQDLTHLPSGDIAPLFGLVSLCNAIGRVFWGAVSDRIGCRQTFAVMFAVQAGVLLCLIDVQDLHWALAGFGVVLLCCGGGFGTMPSYNAEYFGTRFMGRNYGLILSAWGFAGLVGPLLMARAKDLTGSFAGVLPLVAGLLLLSVLLPYLTAKPGVAPAWVRSRRAAEEPG